MAERAGASPYDGHDRLNVRVGRRSAVRLRALLSLFLHDYIIGASLPFLWLPASVLPHVSSQDLHNGPVIFFRLPSYPFEGVDAP
jgi:hypothetical protein